MSFSDLPFRLALLRKASGHSKLAHTFITGYPGSGKTTAASSLAEESGRDHIALDTVPGMDTAEDTTELSRKIIEGLDRDSIIEGVQLMDFDPSYFDRKDLRILELPRKELIRRILRRGFRDTPEGELVRAEDNKDSRERAERFLSQFDDAFRTIRNTR